MRIALANDHVGLLLRRHLEQVITDLGHEVIDFGTDGTDPVAYCDHAFPAAEAVSRGECDRAAEMIVSEFLTASYDGGRFDAPLEKIAAYEQNR